MLKNLSLRAMQAVMLARSLAGDRGAVAIEVEDMLLALIFQDRQEMPDRYLEATRRPGFAASFGPSPQEALFTAETAKDLLAGLQPPRAGPHLVAPESDIPISDALSHVFHGAASLSRELKQTEVQPVHLLAAIAEEEAGEAPRTLRQAGLTAEKILENAPGQGLPLPKGIRKPEIRSRETRPGGRAGLVLSIAKLKAWLKGAGVVDVRDVLSALLIEDQGKVASDFPGIRQYPELLAELEVGAHKPFFPSEVAKQLIAEMDGLPNEPDEEIPPGTISSPVGIALPGIPGRPFPPYILVSLSGHVHRALRASSVIRDELGQSSIEPLHILAAILGDQSSKAGQIIREAGTTRETVLDFVRAQS